MRTFSLICNWSWDKVDKISACDPILKKGRVYTRYSLYSLNRVERVIKLAESKRNKNGHTRKKVKV